MTSGAPPEGRRGADHPPAPRRDERARACAIQAGDYAARYAGVLAAAREQLFAHLGAAERSFVEASVEDFLTSHVESELRPVVLHGDLSPDHVLYDEASRSISGVIDFGDVVIGDPAWDLVYLYEDYGLDFLGRFLPAYPSSDPRRLLERAYRFYVLDLIEWAVRCANEGSPELEEATSELIALRGGSGERREELLSLVR